MLLGQHKSPQVSASVEKEADALLKKMTVDADTSADTVEKCTNIDVLFAAVRKKLHESLKDADEKADRAIFNVLDAIQETQEINREQFEFLVKYINELFEKTGRETRTSLLLKQLIRLIPVKSECLGHLLNRIFYTIFEMRVKTRERYPQVEICSEKLSKQEKGKKFHPLPGFFLKLRDAFGADGLGADYKEEAKDPFGIDQKTASKDKELKEEPGSYIHLTFKTSANLIAFLSNIHHHAAYFPIKNFAQKKESVQFLIDNLRVSFRLFRGILINPVEYVTDAEQSQLVRITITDEWAIHHFNLTPKEYSAFCEAVHLPRAQNPLRQHPHKRVNQPPYLNDLATEHFIIEWRVAALDIVIHGHAALLEKYNQRLHDRAKDREPPIKSKGGPRTYAQLKLLQVIAGYELQLDPCQRKKLVDRINKECKGMLPPQLSCLVLTPDYQLKSLTPAVKHLALVTLGFASTASSTQQASVSKQSGSSSGNSATSATDEDKSNGPLTAAVAQKKRSYSYGGPG